MDQFNAQYHLPGLFEFYALYRLFLPLRPRLQALVRRHLGARAP